MHQTLPWGIVSTAGNEARNVRLVGVLKTIEGLKDEPYRFLRR
jgi:hypothetical protein